MLILLRYQESVLKHHMTSARNTDHFTLLTSDVETEDEQMFSGFDFVVDATGTFGNGNYFGAGGGPAVGELGLLRRNHPGLRKDIPDAAGIDSAEYAGKNLTSVIISLVELI